MIDVSTLSENGLPQRHAVGTFDVCLARPKNCPTDIVRPHAAQLMIDDHFCLFCGLALYTHARTHARIQKYTYVYSIFIPHSLTFFYELPGIPSVFYSKDPTTVELEKSAERSCPSHHYNEPMMLHLCQRTSLWSQHPEGGRVGRTRSELY